MRQWPGPITNLRQAVASERLIWAFCLFCGHAHRFDPRDLAWKYDAAELRAIERKFRCGRCKNRYAILVPSPHGVRVR